MESIEIPPQTDVEIRLACLESATVVAQSQGHDHDTLLAIAHLFHNWVDPAGVDNVEVLRVD